ncbi:MAG: M28 family peptidase [Planctomycetota bacterium]|jgi:hypothetical protein|nr:M28 family peptidase [Planctomycetota bacterium]MDP6764183.1 M28 family peptidase [Planctomycetota bacterium]MDP6990369.1 M28 family peptidase [Planctomycetota bacterium]
MKTIARLSAALLACSLSAAAGSDAALEAALESITAENVSADIHFIASDALAGRDTPSEGLVVAARFVRSRLQRLGIEPGAEDGYFHRYPLMRLGLDAERTRLVGSAPEAAVELSPGSDYWFRSNYLREDVDTGGGVVFAGAGSEEEIEACELEGDWAVVFDDGSTDSRLRRRVRKAGGVGVVLIPTADFDGEGYAERYGPGLASFVEGRVSYPSERGASSRRMSLFPQLALTRSAGLRLLALAAGRPADVRVEDWTPAVGAELGLSLADERRVLRDDESVQMENVCGFWPGSDPELSREVLIVSAHYDHVGARDGKIWNGADDNGSGTTGLLQIAEALSRYGPMRRSVLLIWVSGEEKGLWGSRAWSDAPWLPEGCRPVANLNIDMIGRNAPDELYITPSADHEQHNGIVKLAQRLAPLEGFPALESADDYYHRSDQAMFARMGIPVAFLFAGIHEDYHKPTDTPEKIDCDKLRRVARLIVRLLDGLQTDSLEF